MLREGKLREGEKRKNMMEKATKNGGSSCIGFYLLVNNINDNGGNQLSDHIHI